MTTAAMEEKGLNHSGEPLKANRNGLTENLRNKIINHVENKEKDEVAWRKGNPQEDKTEGLGSVVDGATEIGYTVGTGAFTIKFSQESGRNACGVISIDLPGLTEGEFAKIKEVIEVASNKSDQINEALRIIAIIKGNDQFDRDLSGIHFVNLTLNGVNLGCCRLDNAEWKNVTLSDCCLLGSVNNNSTWQNVTMKDCDCSGSHWRGTIAVEDNCHFDANIFNGAEMIALDQAFAGKEHVTFRANKLIGVDGLAGGRVLGQMNSLLDQLDGLDRDKEGKRYNAVRAEILELFKGTVFEPKDGLTDLKNRLARHNLVRAANADETGVKKSYSDFVEAISQHVHSRDIRITGGRNGVDYIGVILPKGERAFFVKKTGRGESYPSFDEEHSTWNPGDIQTGDDRPLHEIYRLFLMGNHVEEENGALIVDDTTSVADDITVPIADETTKPAAPDVAPAAPVTESEEETTKKAAKKASPVGKPARKSANPAEDTKNDKKGVGDRSAKSAAETKQTFRNKVRVVGRFIADIFLEPPTS